MADGKVLLDKSLEELEREITCAICLHHFIQPKVLPCYHYYCKHCILNLALRTGTDKHFSCPECRKEVFLIDGNVDQLPTAFIVNRFKAAYAALELIHGKVEVKCEACTDSEAKSEAFCRQCAVFICQECVKSHQQLKVYLGHKVVSLEELKQGRAKENVTRDHVAKKCPSHEEPLIVYCSDCDSLICHHCTMKDHRDHNFEFCKISAVNTRKQVLEKLEHLSEVEMNLSRSVDEIQTIKRELASQGDSVVNTILASFEELRKILDKRERELLENVARRVEEKTDKLSLHEKKSSQAKAEVQSVRDYAKQCLQHCGDTEVMSMHAELTSGIEREIEEHSQLGRSVLLVEEVDVGVEVRCADALQQLCLTSANITQLPIDPAKCTVTVEAAKMAEVNTVSDLTLSTRLSNNQPTKRVCEVDCHLKVLSDGFTIKCIVDRIEAGNYSIQYTPTVRGRHELTVSVDGKQVAGSPFPVLVFLPPTQLGMPEHVWAGITWPTGVTANSVGEIIVTECWGDVITFDREGNRLRIVNPKLGYLSGVAVDSEDNIYCTSVGSNKVLTSSKNGDNVQEKQVGGSGHLGVAVVGDEVMVCKGNNKGTIMVYGLEMKFARQIVGEDMGVFRDLSPDCHGNLYVVDYSDSCIRVFSNDGHFLRSFGCDGNGVKKLSGPRGVCVAGRYVYVTDVGSDNVSVFTTEGEYLSSFGHRGRGEGDFSGPLGVCVDKEGFVYVTDFGNNRVQVF